MQMKIVALLAAAGVVSAQSSVDQLSVLSVLETALPPSLISEAITNSAAVSSQIASEFSAGQTPGWFSSLPSDIQTYLVPTITGAASTGASATGNSSAITTNSAALNSSISSAISSISASNSSANSMASKTSKGSATGGSGGSTSSAASSSSSGNAAAIPSGVVGAGFAGALGLAVVAAL